MKHYDHIEWVLYKNKLLDNNIHKKMEEHLFLCDECMDIFLSLIDEKEIEMAGNIVPVDFTEKVLKKIKDKKPIKRINKKKVYNDFFLYYVAVASVTIVLTAGGFFEKIINTESYISATISSTVFEKEDIMNTNTIYEFSEKITSKTSSYIDNFQINKKKED